MILYHGSNQRVQNIDLSKSRPAKDFGRAFHLSSERAQAEEMAQFKVDTFGGEVIVNEYEFDESVLQHPDIKYLHFDFSPRDGRGLCLPTGRHVTPSTTTTSSMGLLPMIE